jgi:hypothetical protein
VGSINRRFCGPGKSRHKFKTMLKIFWYKNGKLRHVETIPGMGKGRDKGK